MLLPHLGYVSEENYAAYFHGAVEAIVAHRIVTGADGAAALLYKVHWRGSGPESDEWFARADLVADFPTVVAAFESARATSHHYQPAET